jgi:hypothetical protein
MRELVQRYPGGELPALHPVADMGIVEQKVVDAADAVRTLRARLDAHTAEQVRAKAWPPATAARSVLLLSAAGHRAACASQGEGAAVPLEAMQRKADLLAEADALQRRMKQSQLTRWAAGRSRSSVLVIRTRLLVQAFTLYEPSALALQFQGRGQEQDHGAAQTGAPGRHGHGDAQGVACRSAPAAGHLGALSLLFWCPSLLAQGRAASEVDTADELLAAELMFNGTFGSLDKHQLAALVSCLVPAEKSSVRGSAACAHPPPTNNCQCAPP